MTFVIRYSYCVEPVFLAGRKRVHFVVSVSGMAETLRPGELLDVEPPHPERDGYGRYDVWKSDTTVCGKRGPWANSGLAEFEHQHCRACLRASDLFQSVPDWAHDWVERTADPLRSVE